MAKSDCSATQCVVQFGPKKGYRKGEVDPKLADAAKAKQDAKDEEMWKQEDIVYERFDRAERHAERRNKRLNLKVKKKKKKKTRNQGLKIKKKNETQ